MKIILGFISFLFIASLQAGPIDALEFKSEPQSKQYFSLIEELRCLKCQNSNISGSNAPLAKDLRMKVYDQIVNQHMSDEEIKSWMVARYGDFVLYKPPVKPTTYLLWGLPLILGILGFILLLTRLSNKTKPEELTKAQQENVDKVINS